MARLPMWIRLVDVRHADDGGVVFTFQLARFWWLHPGAWLTLLRRPR